MNNNNNIPNCCARTHGGYSACKNPGIYNEAVSTKGSNAWARELKKNASEGLLANDIPVCGTHRNQLKAGKAIMFHITKAPEPVQLTLEVPASTSERYLTPHEGMRIQIKGGVSCGNCRKKTGKEVKHGTIDDVKNCYKSNSFTSHCFGFVMVIMLAILGVMDINPSDTNVEMPELNVPVIDNEKVISSGIVTTDTPEVKLVPAVTAEEIVVDNGGFTPEVDDSWIEPTPVTTEVIFDEGGFVPDVDDSWIEVSNPIDEGGFVPEVDDSWIITEENDS